MEEKMMKTKISKWIQHESLYFPTDEDGNIYKNCKGFHSVKDFCHGLAEVSDGKKWGCVNFSGEIIIPIKYDLIDIKKEKDNQIYIKCGRDGVFFTGTKNLVYDDKQYETVYTGIYDMYDANGNLLFGGFDEYKYNDIVNLFFFFIGRIWHFDKTNHWSHFNSIDIYGKWIVLTHEFDFVTHDPYGSHNRYFGKGHIVYPKIIKFIRVAGQYFPEDIAGIMDWVDISGGYYSLLVDLPEDVIFDNIKILNSNQLLCKNKGKYSLIWIKQGIQSDDFSYILPIDDEYAFVLNNMLGLIRYGEIIIPCEYSIITKPINGWAFVFERYPYFPNSDKVNKLYARIIDANVSHHYISEIRKLMLVAEDIDKNKLESDLQKGYYKLLPSGIKLDEAHNLKEVHLTKGASSLFCDEFLKLLGNPTSKETASIDNRYWCSDVILRRERDSNKQNKEFEHNEFSLLDALDGDPDAFWNID